MNTPVRWCTERRPGGCHGHATETTDEGQPVCTFCHNRDERTAERRRQGGRTWGTRGVPAAVRNAVLDRDDHRCRLHYPGCIGTATEADHIVNVASLGIDRAQAVDPDDMQAACSPCHRIKTARERSAAVGDANRRRAARRRQPVQPHPGD